VAANDSYTFLEDAGAQVLDIVTNDTSAAGGTVTMTAAPRLGTAVVNADGTVTYTPNLDASGADSFTYTVTVGTQVSNSATVSLHITPVNDAPVAVNDSVNAVANLALPINVISNDTDPDGAADIVGAVNVTQPAGATVTVNGGAVTFTATATGTYSFSYQAVDASGALSNVATINVNVSGAENLTLTQALYILSKGRLRVSGSVSPAAGQTVRIDLVDSVGTVLSTPATAFPTDGAGAFNYDSQNVARPNGTTSVKVTTSNGTARFLTLTLK
jgi:VCBS repeat-containing protein